MDPALRIVHLRQGVHSLKDHIQDCLDIAYLSDLLDCALIDLFFHELNEPLRSVLIRDGPRGSFYQFLDFALLLTGSGFTVGFEEERTSSHHGCQSRASS